MIGEKIMIHLMITLFFILIINLRFKVWRIIIATKTLLDLIAIII